jgi:transmembrane 9 superfamily member 2/4
MIVLFLTGVVAMIMLRTLHKDISSYNEMQTLEEAQEESGWKLVHGDVFRPPSFSPMLLSVLTGSDSIYSTCRHCRSAADCCCIRYF